MLLAFKRMEVSSMNVHKADRSSSASISEAGDMYDQVNLKANDAFGNRSSRDSDCS